MIVEEGLSEFRGVGYVMVGMFPPVLTLLGIYATNCLAYTLASETAVMLAELGSISLSVVLISDILLLRCPS